MLEKMDAFFEARLAGYDEHMYTAIEGAAEFYAYTAGLLPMQGGSRVLDLGCGTGLELEAYLSRNPGAAVTGIDLSAGMLAALAAKLPGYDLRLVHGSYFEIPFAREYYDAAVSVESLHHFTGAQKRELYQKLFWALKPGGYFVLTDYFAESATLEKAYFSELARLKREQGLPAGGFYHYDTPLTVEHELEALATAGFSDLKLLKSWGATSTLRAARPQRPGCCPGRAEH